LPPATLRGTLGARVGYEFSWRESEAGTPGAGGFVRLPTVRRGVANILGLSWQGIRRRIAGVGGRGFLCGYPPSTGGWQIFSDYPGRESEGGSPGSVVGVFVRLPTDRRGGKYSRIILAGPASGGQRTLLLRVLPYALCGPLSSSSGKTPHYTRLNGDAARYSTCRRSRWLSAIRG
jgi:hypothetical protein